MFLRVIAGVRAFSMSLAHTTTTTTRMAPVVQREIKLTHDEDRLCALLDEFTRFLDREQGIKTACRINGGWVRDKVNPRPLFGARRPCNLVAVARSG